MPAQGPEIYGQRPQKKQKTAVDATLSTDFSAQMASAMAESTASTSSRPKSSSLPLKKVVPQQNKGNKKSKLNLKEILQTREEAKQLELSRKRLQEKAKIYNALKRGDVVKGKHQDSLIDFDRKWAEEQERKEAKSHSNSDSDSDSDSSFEGSDDDTLVEHTDEYGRTRQITRREKRKIDRREMRGIANAQALGDMAAIPKRPENIIYGDVIQTEAFVPVDEKVMSELARKRDRSATPPPQKHYDADWEIRDKGVGFYKFSKDEEKRKEEMESLAALRKDTETKRQDVDEKKRERQRLIEERRKAIGNLRAKKKADDFLNSLV